VLVIAVVFGARVVLFGAARIGAAFAGERADDSASEAAPRPGARWRRWARVLGTAVALGLAVILAVVSVRDYVGLGVDAPHPYLIGQPEGRSVLDAVRAAHQLDGVELEDRTVVWGHSQGGHAALWAGALAPTYAPDVNVIGVAALAPASDLLGLVDNLATITGGTIFAA
jgi:pimeloyl-ACP methyl ester carboxylesterase